MSDTIDVKHLFTMTAVIDAVPSYLIRGGPQGTRSIATVSGGTFEGERLRGTIPERVAAGDWVTLRKDRSVRLDVRILLETDDGVPILMSYLGLGRTDDEGVTRLRTAPTFEVGDEKYNWLNGIQAVGIGSADDHAVTYEVYELL